jgi:hypothetical protein
MSYDFCEDVNLYLPDFEEKLSDFSGANFTESHGLIVEIAAIHAGATNNYNLYSSDQLEKALESWTSPYPKPVIMNHDPHSESVGRVIGAKMDKEADGTPFVRLQAAIVDPAAIQKVSDGRYLTGSVGGKADEAICSVCQTNWAAPKESGLPCKHQRGKVYSGKVAFIEMRGIQFKEYSFVNMPADSGSTVRSKGNTTEGEDWVKAAKYFVLDMVKENIMEYTESETRNVFEGMRKKDTLPIYMGLKGALLSAVAIHEAEQEELKNSQENGVKSHTDNTNEFDSFNSEENDMAKEATQVAEDDDILAVVEDLQDDEAPAAADETTEEPASEDETPEDEVTNETPADEKDGERPEGQEVPHARDIDPETSKGAPRSREDDEDETPGEDIIPDEVVDDAAAPEDSEESPAEEPAKEPDSEEAELTDDETEVDEPHADESLQARIDALDEENARLKKALHRTLAERVVDAKILVGVMESDQRSDAIKDHVTRTASSLADSLRDLAGMPAVSKGKSIDPNDLRINETSEVVEDEENVATIGEEAEDSTPDPMQRAEDLFVDVFMHRKNL